MEPWQERVVEERRELAAKLNKLRNFLYGDREDRLTGDQLRLLYRQEVYMEGYLRTLADRIEDFQRNPAENDERSD
jgi:hypothetical protein